MPKRMLIAVALVALGLAACNNGLNYNSLYGGTPTPTPTASYVPNPGITSVNVLVTVTGTPQPGLTVNEYLAASNTGPKTGSIVATATTDATGTAKFTNLTPTQPYCWEVQFPSPPSGFTSSVCTLYWQNGIRLGD